MKFISETGGGRDAAGAAAVTIKENAAKRERRVFARELKYSGAAGILISLILVCAAGFGLYLKSRDLVAEFPTPAAQTSIQSEEEQVSPAVLPQTKEAESVQASPVEEAPAVEQVLPESPEFTFDPILSIPKADPVMNGCEPVLQYTDGRISGTAYLVKDQTYINICPLLESFGISCSIADNEKETILEGTGFELIAPKGESYIITNGRYQYVPNGCMITGGSSGGGIPTGGSSGSGGTFTPGSSGNGFYLPADAAKKILNVSVSRKSSAVDVSTKDMALMQGGEYYYDINLNADMFYWLPHIIFSEAHDESLESKLAVANVVLNRMKYKEFPNTIYGVIYDTKYAVQFSPVAIGGIKGTPDDLSYVAAFLAIEGYNNIGNCMFYVNPEMPGASDQWFKEDLVYFDTIGSHDYYFKPGTVME